MRERSLDVFDYYLIIKKIIKKLKVKEREIQQNNEQWVSIENIKKTKNCNLSLTSIREFLDLM